jgi:hypothetical protein
MLAEHRVPTIAFVWRPEEMTLSVAQMAGRTGSAAVFDLSMMETQAVQSFLAKAAPASRARNIKISAATLMDPSLGRLLRETGVQNI